jgi:hypothetical protein
MPANVEALLPEHEQLFATFEAESVVSDPLVFEQASVAVSDMRVAYADEQGNGGWAYVEDISGVEISQGEVSVFLSGRKLRFTLSEEEAPNFFSLLTDLAPFSDDEPEWEQ